MSSRLKLKNLNGNNVVIRLNVTSYSLGLALQMHTDQVKYGAAHRPVRDTEQTLQFTCIWAANRENEMRRLEAAIRQHHLFCLDTSATPMFLEYSKWRTFRGMIETVPRETERFKSKFERSFSMRLWLSEPTFSRGVKNRNNPIVPTSREVVGFGGDWYNVRQHDQEAYTVVPRYPSGGSIPQ